MASGKILIVDDDTNICELLRLYIEKEGFEAAIANDGEGALKKFDSFAPDLMLLDYEMPVCDGKQTLEMIRSYEAFADLPVIFLTGRRDTQSMIQVMPLKPAGYLLKTSKPEELKKEIDAFFEKNKKKE